MPLTPPATRPKIFLPWRAWAFALTLAVECLAVANVAHPWFKPQQIMAAPIAFGAALLFFGRDTLSRHLTAIASPLQRRFLLLHLFALTLVFTSAGLMLHGHTAPALLWTWFAAVPLLAFSLAATLFPLHRWSLLLRDLGAPILYAAATTVAAMSARGLAARAWNSTEFAPGVAVQRATFAGVKLILSFLYPTIVVHPEHWVLGTPGFAVELTGACSGIEGLVLLFVLAVGWIIFLRRELRLNRALWLIAPALLAMWLLNLLRLTALIAIGDAGHTGVAMNGFHSEAGWILFNAIAIAFLVLAQNLPWLRKNSSAPTPADSPEYRATLIYLTPFLAILAASMASHAVSSGFEALYPLRFFAALFVLWLFRADYRNLNHASSGYTEPRVPHLKQSHRLRWDRTRFAISRFARQWRFGWLGPAAGLAIAVMWLALAHPTASPLALQLAQLPAWQRIAWISIRILAAVVTVPIAEEFAFRAYLARRIVSPNVDSIPLTALTPLAIAISSLAFGLLHGSMWIAGTLSGLIFALVAKRTGRIADAIAAHATANLILAAVVLTRHDYSLW